MVQNAVDFSRSKVLINVVWTTESLTIQILDDGPGFPGPILSRIGDPFMGNRKPDNQGTFRQEYEGMGLGLFIAKTLLERTSAELMFSNGRDEPTNIKVNGYKAGAIVTITWARQKIEQQIGALGQNQALEI